MVGGLQKSDEIRHVLLLAPPRKRIILVGDEAEIIAQCGSGSSGQGVY
jgi:hypothetical protein